MTQFSERPRFDIGRVIERTFGVVGHNIVPFLVFAVLLNGLPALGLQLVQNAFASGELVWSPAYLIYALVGAVIWIMVAAILQGALLRGALDDLNGGQASMGGMLQAGVRNAFKLFLIGVLILIAAAVGFLLVIIPCFIVLVLFVAAAPAAVEEGAGVFGSLERSIKLTENHRWAVFGLGVIFVVLAMIVSGVFGAVLVGASMGSGVDVKLTTAIVTPIIGVIEIIIGTAAYAALYHELRAVKEGAASRSVAGVFD